MDKQKGWKMDSKNRMTEQEREKDKELQREREDI